MGGGEGEGRVRKSVLWEGFSAVEFTKGRVSDMYDIEEVKDVLTRFEVC